MANCICGRRIVRNGVEGKRAQGILTSGPEVRARFQSLHEDGEWERYTRYTSAGRNNPNVNVAEVYSVYARGVDYYSKENWGVEVRILSGAGGASTAMGRPGHIIPATLST